MATELRTGWTPIPFNHHHAAFSSDISYFEASTAVREGNTSVSPAPFSLLQQVIDRDFLTKSLTTLRSDHDDRKANNEVVFRYKTQQRKYSYPPSPNKTPVPSQPGIRQRKTYEAKHPVNITKTTTAKESRAVKFRKAIVWGLGQSLKALVWSYSTGLWLLKGGWGYVSQAFFACKKSFYDRKPQQLTLPSAISVNNPGWDVQAHQLSYEFMQMKGCFTQLDQKALLQFPLKFAMEITFADADETQTVSSKLLISSKAHWNKLGSFVDELYKQVVFVRKQNPVSDKFTMEVAFTVVCQEQEGENKIYQRSNQYKNGTKADDLAKGVSVQTCKKDKIDATINSIPGIKLTKEWIIGLWVSSGKVLATYADGKSDSINLLVTDK